MKTVLYIVIVIGLLSYVVFKDRGIKDYIELSNKYSQIIKENIKLEKENKKYRELIKRLKMDKSYIEKIAREKYNMIKPNEILIKIEKKGEKK